MSSVIRIILSMLVLLAGNAVGAESSLGLSPKPRMQVTTDYFFETCTVVGQTARGMIPYFDCESYVYGVLDTYLEVKESIPKTERACFPANIEPWRVVEIAYQKYQLETRFKSDDIAAPLIIKALRKKFPCSL